VRGRAAARPAESATPPGGGDPIHDDHQMSAPTRVRVRVPSKINLFLAVHGRRPDGYHDLVSVLQTVSLYDTVTAQLRGPTAQHPAARRSMRLDFTHDATPGVPADGDNLAVRAARAVMAEVGLGTADNGNGPSTHVHLDKAIPVAAGMAGGSADAAAALLALDELWAAGLGRERLRELAAELGADVPFCVGGGTALATGTGTATAQILTRGTYHWVIGVTDEPLSTPAVYRAYDELGLRSERAPDAVFQALLNGDAEALGAAMHNDLEAAATSLRPDLATKRAAMLEAGALGALVSGSGPTIVGLAPSAQDVPRIAEEVADVFDRVEIALSPAGGPEVTRD
jgi:4-diphosphocytidyl-2-C-methyl-D-erythritol kinase